MSLAESRGMSRFHSINKPNEWGLARISWQDNKKYAAGFHSINIPNEWGFYSCTPG